MQTVILNSEVQDLYKQSDSQARELMRRLFGDDVFPTRPVSVWCVNNSAAVIGDGFRPELIPFNKWDTDKHIHPVCVAVVTDETAFLVGLHNTVVAQWGIPGAKGSGLWTDKESTDSAAATDAILAACRGKIYHDPDGDKEYDFFGSPAAEFCRRYSAGPIGEGKWDLPTVKVLKIMSEYRVEINRCLLAMGFPTLVMGYYWSSIATESEDNRCAWCVRLYDGYTYDTYRSSGHYVRAVSAFQNLGLEI